MQEEIVNLIRKDQLLKLYSLVSQCLYQMHCLAKRHVAVVVAVNQ